MIWNLKYAEKGHFNINQIDLETQNITQECKVFIEKVKILL